MRALLLLLLLLLSCLSHTCGSGEDSWTSNSYEPELRWFEPEPLEMMLKRMVQRPVQQQFFGLMGRRSSAKSQITRKRQKFQTFVGLMGKRSEDGG